MGELDTSHNHDSKDHISIGQSMTSLNMKKLRAKGHLGGKMNHEEIKMNKKMLNEINNLKKSMGDNYGSPN